MNRNAWIVIVVVIVIILLGWIVYGVSQNNTPLQQTPETTTPPITEAIPNQPDNSTSTSVNTSVNIATPKTVSVTVTGSNFAFNPKEITVKKGDTVKVTFVNSGGTHDWKLEGYNVGTNTIQGGQSQTVTFVADKAGDFQYYCSVGSHRAMGMWGTLHVTT